MSESRKGTSDTPLADRLRKATPGKLYGWKQITAKLPEHDGKLDEDSRYTVSHDTGRSAGKYHYVRIQGKYNIGDDEISLSPEQAISLLSWLQQERSTLEQLAKETGR